ncbi:MAG: hypothetical protein M3466_16780 [Gemmatimonadota bacterium]|nr:hypothetical protein [Gemmatimonadota bacterium]
MSGFGLSSAIRKLVARHIRSMDHVQTLLLLHRTAPQEWEPAAIAREITVQPELVDLSLRDLTASGLVSEIGVGDSQRKFAYAPADEALRRDVDELAAMYNERPVTLIRAIYDRPPEPAVTFADAFAIRSDSR